MRATGVKYRNSRTSKLMYIRGSNEPIVFTSDKDGFNALIIDSQGKEVSRQTFDLLTPDDFEKFLTELPETHMLMLASYGDVSSITQGTKDFLKKMGGDQIEKYESGMAYVFAGIIGKTKGKDESSDDNSTMV